MVLEEAFTWLSDICPAFSAASADWTLDIDVAEVGEPPLRVGLEPWTDDSMDGGELASVDVWEVLNPLGLEPTDWTSRSSEDWLSLLSNMSEIDETFFIK